MTNTHSSFHIEMDEIYTEINKRKKNLFVEKYVEIPEMSTLKLQLLNLSLYSASVPRTVRKLYCIAAGLIQMGLDLHESITTHKEINERSIRNRQLSILAGDYYSSQYYSLLANHNLTEGIKSLALGIRNINIAKMNLYTGKSGQEFKSLEELIQVYKIKESNLHIQFMNIFQSKQLVSLWEYIIENMIFLFSLSDELQSQQMNKFNFLYHYVNYHANFDEQIEIKDFPSESNIKLKNLFHKYDIQRKTEDLIQHIYTNLNNKIKNIEDRVIQGELIYLLNQFSSVHQLKAVEKI